jgi:hypothetical protein
MPNSTSKIYSMVAEGDSEEEDQAMFNIISQLLRVTQDSDGWRAFHKPARVTLANGRQVDLRVALFDTGADRDNYIRTRCVKDNCLEEFLTPVSNKVKVASGVVVPIESKLEVDLTFLDHCGDSHTASVIFMVLEGLGKDLVIGQPAITLHFFEIFQEATEQFYEMLPTKVSEEFKQATPIMKLLETLGEEVCNPKSWEGINGYEVGWNSRTLYQAG